MLKTLSIFAGALMGLSQPLAAAEVAVDVEKIFIPNGFDDNDRATVVVSGNLPNTCHKLAGHEVSFDTAAGTLTIEQYATVGEGFCLQMQVPFWNEVDLGVLPQGQFLIKAGATQGNIAVTEALNAGPDDFLYAPVSSVSVEMRSVDQRYVAILQGDFTNSCMAIDRVLVTNTASEVVIQPIMEIDENQTCEAVMVPFREEIVLPMIGPEARYLVHTRSLNGKAVNSVFYAHPFHDPIF